jgi:hydroxymethylbilane synthase
MNPVLLGTRGSPLALAQAEIVRGLLQRAHPALAVQLAIIKTSGDMFHNLSLAAGGGKGLFTREIEDQLARGAIQVAVHSMKDLPTTLPDGLMLAATPPREDVRDVLIAKHAASPDELPDGARVATSSIRRRAQLLARRPDLRVEEIRGNVETRLRKLRQTDALEALVLAAAGLNRLRLWDGLGELRVTTLEVEVMVPAVGQGAIACETRADDAATRGLLAAINDADTLARVEAERAFLRALGGGCQVPYAAHATVEGDRLLLVGATFDPDGADARRTSAVGERANPRELGERAAREVLR